MNSYPTELDELFADALSAERKHPQKVMRNARAEAPKPIGTLEKYSLPEYWRAGKMLILIHEETSTALGIFQEYFHKTEVGARKLLRVEGPTVASKLEYVSGDGWLGFRRDELLCEPQRWTEERQLVLSDLFLHSFDVHSELVEVIVKLKFGGISRVELYSHTTFHSPAGTIALTLPAGTNIYEVMDLEAKVNLRKELQ